MLEYSRLLEQPSRRLRVLRFTDREVLTRLDAVVEAIFAAVEAGHKSP